jgi:hypothetical protein
MPPHPRGRQYANFVRARQLERRNEANGAGNSGEAQFWSGENTIVDLVDAGVATGVADCPLCSVALPCPCLTSRAKVWTGHPGHPGGPAVGPRG